MTLNTLYCVQVQGKTIRVCINLKYLLMSFGKLNRKGGEDKVGLVSEGLGPKS